MGFAVACAQAGREDLMPMAVERFAHALDKDLASGQIVQTAIMEHAHPIGWLFHYYYYAGEFGKALRYGKLMMRREPPDAARVCAFFDVAMNAHQRQEAANALKVLMSADLPVHPMDTALRLIRFGQQYRDRPSLLEAERLLQQLAREYPTELSYHRALRGVRDVLRKNAGATTTQNPTSPATTRAGDQ
jgi:hypothetical protein